MRQAQIETQPRLHEMTFYSLALPSDNCFCYPISQMQADCEVTHEMLCIFAPSFYENGFYSLSLCKGEKTVLMIKTPLQQKCKEATI